MVLEMSSVYLSGLLLEQGVMFHFDQGVAGLFQNGHELKDGEARRISWSWNLRSNRLRIEE